MAAEFAVSEAREHLSDVVKAADREPVLLTKRGRRVAVLLSAAEYERLKEVDEDAEDLAAADAVMAEIMSGSPTIPWSQVRADLGLA